LAQPGQRKHVLDHDRAADQVGQIDSEDGHGREHRVAQDVPDEQSSATQAFGPGSVDEVGIQDSEDAVPKRSDQDRREPESDRQRRQEQLVEVIQEAAPIACNREEVEMQVQQEDEH